MWLFTLFGFFSVVQSAEKRKGQKGPMMMIRGRDLKEMKNLVKYFDVLRKYKIQTGVGTDYKYRVVVTKKDWLTVSDLMTRWIEYPNFKDAVASVPNQSPEYVQRLMRLWALIRQVYGVVDLAPLHEPFRGEDSYAAKEDTFRL